MAKNITSNGAQMEERHKQFVDYLFTNGFNKGKAYESVYGPGKKMIYTWQLASNLFKRENVQEYYKIRMVEYREEMDMSKQRMLDRLVKLDNLYEELLDFATRMDPLTDAEEERVSRMKTMLSSREIAKTRDMLMKMLGYYEAERKEIEHTGLTINYIKPEQKEDQEGDQEDE
tara:strand:- start:330 stop:848 length:519 start_codon:yes stop_codon:yes gene_type:complete